MFLEQMEGQELAGRFLLRRLVGQGGYGAVFEAEQLSVGRRCAVKVLLPDQCENEAIARRFTIEARAISQLVHANSVILYDFGQSADHNKLLYLAMEFLEGQDLNQLIEVKGQIDLGTTVHIARQIGGSLHEAHTKGLVHRDVKPHNVMLIERHNDPYFVKVIDFGIAKALQSSRLTIQELTQAGTMIGTPHYMAPEQVLDGEVDGRTDQYALATTLYKMLAGRTPFQGMTAIEVASKQLNEKPLPVSTYRTDLKKHGTLDNVLLRALSKRPAERFADVMEFIDAFAAAAAKTNDEPYFCGESTLVDAPGAGSVQEEVLPKTVQLEPVRSQTSVTAFDDEPVGATLAIAQDLGFVEAAISVEEKSQHSQGPPALKKEQTSESRLMAQPQRRNITAEITSSMASHKWLIATALVLTCIFLLLFGLVFGRVLSTRFQNKEDNDKVRVAESGIVKAEARKVDSQIVADSNEDDSSSVEGSVIAELEKKPIDTTSTKVVAKDAALFVQNQAQNHVIFLQEQKLQNQKKIALAQQAADKAKVEQKQQMGRVRVTLIPWGTLYVNRKAYTDKPRQELRLAPGRYTFILKQGTEEKVRKTVDVGAGSNTMVELVAK